MKHSNRIRTLVVVMALSAAPTFFTGCSGNTGGGGVEPATNRRKFPPHNSPITVADGSMVVRTNAAQSAHDGELDITGGQACSISFAHGTQTVGVQGANWNLTSYDQMANVSTTDNGATVIAYGPNYLKVNSDPTEGQGYEFGVEAVQFSPAKLTITTGSTPSPCPSACNCTGLPYTCNLDCGQHLCKVIINYLIGGSCPVTQSSTGSTTQTQRPK